MTSTRTTTRALSTQAHLDAARATFDRVSATLDRLDAASAKRSRSLELAAQAGLGPWAVTFRRLVVGRDGQPSRVDVDAPSGSVPFVSHRVVVDLRAWTASCDCVAATFGRPCRHAGAALRYGGCVVIAYREAQAERSALRDLALEDNARCLGFSH